MQNKYYNISGTYVKKYAGFIPLPYFHVIEKVSIDEIKSKGAALKFKEKTGFKALENSLLITPFVEIPEAEQGDGKFTNN